MSMHICIFQQMSLIAEYLDVKSQLPCVMLLAGMLVPTREGGGALGAAPSPPISALGTGYSRGGCSNFGAEKLIHCMTDLFTGFHE